MTEKPHVALVIMAWDETALYRTRLNNVDLSRCLRYDPVKQQVILPVRTSTNNEGRIAFVKSLRRIADYLENEYPEESHENETPRKQIDSNRL